MHRDAQRARRLACAATDIYILIMLLVFPLFTGFEGYFNITASKFVFFAGVASLWLSVLAFCAVLGLPRLGVLRSPPLCAMALFLLVSCLSAAFSPYGSTVLLGAGRYGGLYTLLLYALSAIGVAKLANPRKYYIYCIALSVSVCCVVALLQLLGGNPLGLFPDGLCYYDAHILYDGEFLGTIGNADLLSAFLCLGIPLLAAAFIKQGGRAAWFLIPAALGTFTLIASRVSGGAVALLAAAAFAVPLLASDLLGFRRTLLTGGVLLYAAALALAFHAAYEGPGSAVSVSLRFGWEAYLASGLAATMALAALGTGWIRRFPPKCVLRRFIIALELCLFAAGLALIYFRPWGAGTVYELSRILHGEIRDSFGSSRIRIWRAILALIPERPVFGGGPDTLALRLDITFSRLVPETGRILSVSVDNAHNEYLGILADLGFTGLTAYLAAMALTVFSRRRWNSGRDGLGCALLCYWVQSFFGLGLCLVAPLMWILWGLFLSGKEEYFYYSKEATEWTV